MKNSLFFSILATVLAICISGCSGEDEQSKAQLSQTPQTLIVMTHDSFSISEDVLKKFQDDHNAIVSFLKSGDAGEALNKAVLSKDNPMADVFFGIDNTFISRALENDIFIPYASPKLALVHEFLKPDFENRLVPVDFGDVCINYDKAWFAENKISPPTCLEDLLKPDYKGLLVVENPATSSPGLAFLLATVSRFGVDGYLDFWKSLDQNDLLITNGWKEAYWGHFTAASTGDRPLVVSYASSPAAEVFYAETKPEQAPTGVVTGNGSAFRQIEYAGILRGTTKQELAKAFIDFMLSPPFQEDIPLQMFVFPAVKGTVLPDVFKKHARISTDFAILPGDEISTMRDAWIEAWTKTLL